MIPEYCERFDLDSDPFTNSSFYITPDIELLVDQITHASQFSAGFVVVCGEAGVGKTAFAKYFYSQLSATQESILLDVAVASSAQALLLQLADFLALPVSAESTMGELLAQLRTVMNSGSEALAVTMVLDNAQLLADDTLAALASLLQVPAGHHRPFSFVLFSELELAPRLDQFQMPDVAVQDIAFSRMAASDVTEMLNYRLELAGFVGEPLFNLQQVKQLCRDEDGRLDDVLEKARLDLQERHTEVGSSNAPAKKSTLPVVHITAVAGLLAALGLVYLYQGGESEPAEQVKRLPAPAAPSIVKKQAAIVAADNLSNKRIVNNEVYRSGAQGSISAGSEPSASVELQAPPATIKPEGLPAVSESPDVNQKPASLSARSEAASTDLSASGDVPTAPNETASASVAVVWPNDEAEILSWPASAYSLQVLGVSNREAAKAYVQKQENSDQLRIMATKRSDKPWYIVLAGRYESVVQAKKAAVKLPATQIKAGPWPRRVELLQQEIRTD